VPSDRSEISDLRPHSDRRSRVQRTVHQPHQPLPACVNSWAGVDRRAVAGGWRRCCLRLAPRAPKMDGNAAAPALTASLLPQTPLPRNITARRCQSSGAGWGALVCDWLLWRDDGDDGDGAGQRRAVPVRRRPPVTRAGDDGPRGPWGLSKRGADHSSAADLMRAAERGLLTGAEPATARWDEGLHVGEEGEGVGLSSPALTVGAEQPDGGTQAQASELWKTAARPMEGAVTAAAAAAHTVYPARWAVVALWAAFGCLVRGRWLPPATPHQPVTSGAPLLRLSS
jgi:hypothetical protein